MYFPDLTPYAYGASDPAYASHIGWLDADEPFATGLLPDGFLDALAGLYARPVRRTRGLHGCPFCDPDERAYSPKDLPWQVDSFEIRAFHPRGRAFAAPGLIHHYIAVHGYRPPDLFVDAVLHSAQDIEGFIARVDAAYGSF